MCMCMGTLNDSLIVTFGIIIVIRSTPGKRPIGCLPGVLLIGRFCGLLRATPDRAFAWSSVFALVATSPAQVV